jgi:HEPN domain-containing protein
MDNITKRMLGEFYILSAISKNFACHKYVSAVICGEFSELVMKYIIQEHSSAENVKTHNLFQLLKVIKRYSSPEIRPKVQSIVDRIPQNIKLALVNLDYTKYRYQEISQSQLDIIFEVHKACIKLLEVI